MDSIESDTVSTDNMAGNKDTNTQLIDNDGVTSTQLMTDSDDDDMSILDQMNRIQQKLLIELNDSNNNDNDVNDNNCGTTDRLFIQTIDTDIDPFAEPLDRTAPLIESNINHSVPSTDNHITNDRTADTNNNNIINDATISADDMSTTNPSLSEQIQANLKIGFSKYAKQIGPKQLSLTTLLYNSSTDIQSNHTGKHTHDQFDVNDKAVPTQSNMIKQSNINKYISTNILSRTSSNSSIGLVHTTNINQRSSNSTVTVTKPVSDKLYDSDDDGGEDMDHGTIDALDDYFSDENNENNGVVVNDTMNVTQTEGDVIVESDALDDEEEMYLKSNVMDELDERSDVSDENDSNSDNDSEDESNKKKNATDVRDADAADNHDIDYITGDIIEDKPDIKERYIDVRYQLTGNILQLMSHIQSNINHIFPIVRSIQPHSTQEPTQPHTKLLCADLLKQHVKLEPVGDTIELDDELLCMQSSGSDDSDHEVDIIDDYQSIHNNQFNFFDSGKTDSENDEMQPTQLDTIDIIHQHINQHNKQSDNNISDSSRPSIESHQSHTPIRRYKPVSNISPATRVTSMQPTDPADDVYSDSSHHDEYSHVSSNNKLSAAPSDLFIQLTHRPTHNTLIDDLAEEEGDDVDSNSGRSDDDTEEQPTVDDMDFIANDTDNDTDSDMVYATRTFQSQSSDIKHTELLQARFAPHTLELESQPFIHKTQSIGVKRSGSTSIHTMLHNTAASDHIELSDDSDHETEHDKQRKQRRIDMLRSKYEHTNDNNSLPSSSPLNRLHSTIGSNKLLQQIHKSTSMIRQSSNNTLLQRNHSNTPLSRLNSQLGIVKQNSLFRTNTSDNINAIRTASNTANAKSNGFVFTSNKHSLTAQQQNENNNKSMNNQQSTTQRSTSMLQSKTLSNHSVLLNALNKTKL